MVWYKSFPCEAGSWMKARRVAAKAEFHAGEFLPRERNIVNNLGTPSRAVYALAIAAVALHMAFSGRFGFFRDELYYAACGQRLAWGYVDHAPLAPFLARLSGALLGDSLPALRFLPALAASAKVLLGGWMARELGGAQYAQFLAAFCVLLAPVYLTFDNFFSMNAFLPVVWMACAQYVLSILNV